MVTQLTHPFEDHAPPLRGKSHLLPLPQTPTPSLNQLLELWEQSWGLLLWLKHALYKEHIIWVAQGLSQVLRVGGEGTGSQVAERRRLGLATHLAAASV